MKLLVSVLIITLFVSCASNRQLTREEFLAVGQKTFKDVDKEKLIKAAQEVLTLCDGTDFQFSHTPNGFVGSRRWLIYMVLAAAMGTDFWYFNIEEKQNELKASLYVSTSSGNIGGYYGGNGASTITTPNQGFPIQGTAIYDIFWNRLDYMLGRTNQWMSCDDELDKIRKGETWGNLENFCGGVTVNDDPPTNLTESEVQRIFKGDHKYDAKMKYLRKYYPESKLLQEPPPPSKNSY